MDDLETIRNYLDDVKRACEKDRNSAAFNQHLVRELDAIKTSAEELGEQFVLRFGIIGDSNAGKSQLIGGLIGAANALPVSPIPFTGNIAILRIRSSAQITATELRGYRLKFISLNTAIACASHLCGVILHELEPLKNVSELVHSGQAVLNAFKGGSLGFEKAKAWLDAVWERATDRNVNLRARLVELIRFLITWERLQPALSATNKSESTVAQPAADWEPVIPVERPVAEAAMLLPTTLPESRYAQLVDAIEDQVTKAIGRPGPLERLPTTIDLNLATVCYPIVQEIHIEVSIPTAVWDLSKLHVHAIELYDFPGLAAQINAGRDAYLSLRERERNRIHTWVIVINSTELRGCQATEIVRELPRERVVAVANRFDGLPLIIQNDVAILEQLAHGAGSQSPISEREVLQRLVLLPPLTTLFDQLTQPRRCAVVSAMIGLIELHRNLKIPRVLSDTQLTNFTTKVQEGVDVLPTWVSLAKRIQQAEPNSTLANWLLGYAQPKSQGGLVRLREMLFEHANDVGLVQLADELKSRIAPLKQSIDTVLAIARSQATESTLQANELRKRIDQLVVHYQDDCRPPESLESIRISPRVMSALPGSAFEAATQRSYSTSISLAELIRDETLMRVWSWREWRTLLEAVRPNCFVEVSTGSPVTAVTDDDDNVPWKTEEKILPPTRAGEFFAKFCECYRQVEAVAMSALKASLTEYLDSFARKLSPLATDLSGLATNAEDNPLNTALRPNGSVALDYLLRIVKPIAEESPTANFWRERYPYLLHLTDDGELSPGPYFGWAPQRRGPGNKTEHQLYVLRLRSELTSTIESHVLRTAASVLSRFLNRLSNLQAGLNEAAVTLKERTDADLLALFGQAVSHSPRANFELASVNRQLLSITERS